MRYCYYLHFLAQNYSINNSLSCFSSFANFCQVSKIFWRVLNNSYNKKVCLTVTCKNQPVADLMEIQDGRWILYSLLYRMVVILSPMIQQIKSLMSLVPVSIFHNTCIRKELKHSPLIFARKWLMGNSQQGYTLNCKYLIARDNIFVFKSMLFSCLEFDMYIVRYVWKPSKHFNICIVSEFVPPTVDESNRQYLVQKCVTSTFTPDPSSSLLYICIWVGHQY